MIESLLKMGNIGRRYFVVNSFDGVLTVLGIVMGSLISSVTEPQIVLSAGIGASIALGISGVSSAYLSERAEKKKDIKELEQKMLSEVKGERRTDELMVKPIKVSIINGLSPFITGIICLLPFVLSLGGFLTTSHAYYASIGTSLSLLIFLGYFLGTVSKGQRMISAVKMFLVGIATIIVLYLLGIGGF